MLPPQIVFGSFRLEIEPDCLWQGSQKIPLRPRTLAMLQYLVTHPQRLVTKAELRQHVWEDAHLTDTVLRTCVQEIRAALGDRPDNPTYLETVRGQGYRFLGGGDDSVTFTGTTGFVVGRQAEMHQLTERFSQVVASERQFVLLSGEPGIGKTTLVELFLDRMAERQDIRMGRSQCVIHYGEGEAYRPVLEALGRLGREPDGKELISLLRHYAPMWLAQLPALISQAELERVQHLTQGATQNRMVRELCEAIEALTADTPLIIVIEDLQWSDVATLELLAALAQRPEFARLFILGTYRPADAVLYAPVLREVVQELHSRNQCDEIALELFSEADVSSYVAGSLGGEVSESLTKYLGQRSGGNPLFMVNLLAHLVEEDAVVQRGGQWWLAADKADALAQVPEGLRPMIQHRLERQPESNRQVLEAASVAGVTFTTATVAAGLEQGQEDVESQCESLAFQGDFLQAIGVSTGSDGALSGRYRFRHALYRQVLYEQLGESRRVRLHRRIAERLEAGHGAQAGEAAAELAFHFEQGHDERRAMPYRHMAAERALYSYAYREAIQHLRRLLDGLQLLPETSERDQQELSLLTKLGAALIATQGYVSPEVGQAYTRAQVLCHRFKEMPQHFSILWNIWNFHMVRGELQQGRELAEQLLDMAQNRPNTELDLMAHDAMAQSYFWQGALADAHQHAEQVMARYDPRQHQELAPLYGYEDPLVACLSTDALTLWLQGYPDQALTRIQKSLELAHELGNPHTLAFAMVFASFLHQFRRDAPATRRQAEALVTLATEQGFGHWLGVGACFRGWAMAVQEREAEGLSQVQQGLDTWRATGAMLGVPYLLFLQAEAHQALGQIDAARTSLSEAQALAEHNGERWWDAEFYRLDGDILLTSDDNRQEDAEACFRQALEVARQQQAKSLELRVAMRLSRLWRQGKHAAAHQLLSEVYGWFREGFDTADLQEAGTV